MFSKKRNLAANLIIELRSYAAFCLSLLKITVNQYIYFPPVFSYQFYNGIQRFPPFSVLCAYNFNAAHYVLSNQLNQFCSIIIIMLTIFIITVVMVSILPSFELTNYDREDVVESMAPILLSGLLVWRYLKNFCSLFVHPCLFTCLFGSISTMDFYTFDFSYIHCMLNVCIYLNLFFLTSYTSVPSILDCQQPLGLRPQKVSPIIWK